MPQNQNNQISFSFRNSVVRKPTGFHASGFWQFTCENHELHFYSHHSLSVLGSVQCPAVWLQDCWRSPLPVSAPWTSYTGSIGVGISHSPEFILVHWNVLLASTSLSATAPTLLIEFTAFTPTANTTQIQIKAVALLRELLKQYSAAKLSRVAAALPEAFTRSVEHTLTELSSPSPPTQKRQEKEAGFTPSFKQA